MWCDDFDMDALKVIPEAPEILARVREVHLLTHGHLTNGVLNHPTVWNSDQGTVAFVAPDDGQDVGLWNAVQDRESRWHSPYRPGGYVGDDPLLRCTGEELLRDWWAHTYAVADRHGRLVVRAVEWEHFERLMYALRGWTQTPPELLAESRAYATYALRLAADKLLELAGK